MASAGATLPFTRTSTTASTRTSHDQYQHQYQYQCQYQNSTRCFTPHHRARRHHAHARPRRRSHASLRQAGVRHPQRGESRAGRRGCAPRRPRVGPPGRCAARFLVALPDTRGAEPPALGVSFPPAAREHDAHAACVLSWTREMLERRWAVGRHRSIVISYRRAKKYVRAAVDWDLMALTHVIHERPFIS